MMELEGGSCLRFVEHSNEEDYLDFFQGGSNDACWSWIGRIGGRQEISLLPGCWNSHSVAHEVSCCFFSQRPR